MFPPFHRHLHPEPVRHSRSKEVGQKPPYRHDLEPFVVGAVDLSLPTLADLFDDAVVANVATDVVLNCWWFPVSNDTAEDRSGANSRAISINRRPS